jgi:hypothetical protein
MSVAKLKKVGRYLSFPQIIPVATLQDVLSSLLFLEVEALLQLHQYNHHIVEGGIQGFCVG